MAKKIRNFAAILAVSAVVGTILLVLVFLLPVGPMRKNVEKSVGDMLKTGDEIPEGCIFAVPVEKQRDLHRCYYGAECHREIVGQKCLRTRYVDVPL